jgi:hypothetical protein
MLMKEEKTFLGGFLSVDVRNVSSKVPSSFFTSEATSKKQVKHFDQFNTTFWGAHHTYF